MSTFLDKPNAFDVGPRVLDALHRIPCGSWVGQQVNMENVAGRYPPNVEEL